MNGNGQRPPNGTDAVKQATNLVADMETRRRMCAAELESVLGKYGMILAAKEIRINGQTTHFEFAVLPADAGSQQQAQPGRILTPPR